LKFQLLNRSLSRNKTQSSHRTKFSTDQFFAHHDFAFTNHEFIELKTLKTKLTISYTENFHSNGTTALFPNRREESRVLKRQVVDGLMCDTVSSAIAESTFQMLMSFTQAL